MKPVSRKDRVAYNGGPRISVANAKDPGHYNIDELRFLNDPEDLDSYTEDGDMSFIEDMEEAKPKKKLNDEEIKIKALNLAIGIAKLMSDVNIDDVLKIAGKVAIYVKY